MPTADCEEGKRCLPPPTFAKEFCKDRYPGLAIAMFEKNTPWQRMYVAVERLPHVNTYGGTVSTYLLHTEEVIILNEQSANTGGMTISGANDVDVLRWDGTCATVREGNLTEHRTPTVENATVIWRYLDKATQESLLRAKYVNVRYSQQREVCRRSSASNPTDAYKKATAKLNDAITVAVRGGMKLDEPTELPLWKRDQE